MTVSQQTKPNTTIIQDKKLSPYAKVIDLACIAVVLILVALTFGRTLESFFIADDFGEVSYVHEIFSGKPNLFWSNFTGNYMQIPSMSVWRPWLLATLVFDYAVWKANAFGYYLTNLLYYAGNSILIYALLRKLTASWTPWRSHATAFFTSALFTVSPLHCESVTWVVGRVDIACCFYYLFSFLLLLNNGKFKKLSTIIATVSFWLALWTKEMAIGLPVMVTAAYWLLLTDEGKPIEKLKQALIKASPLWISTIIYFPLRYLFLGTLTGGYTGSIGASQFTGLVRRWLDPDTLHRIIYPLNYSLFQDNSIYAPVLSAIYFIAGAIAISRLLNRELSVKWAGFLFIWFATCAVPIYQLWGLGYDLEGSRFYYFLSLPLSFALPLLLLQPKASADGDEKRWPIFVSLAILSVFTFTSSKIAYATNMTWVHAGKEAKAVFQESKTLAENNTGKCIILGLPKRNSAAHMILNGQTYRLMLSPPFTNTDIADQFITFEPVMFGPAEFINTYRFKKTIAASTPAFVWSSKDKQFRKLTLDKPEAEAQPLQLSGSRQANKWQPYHAGPAIYSENGNTVSIIDPKPGDGLSFPNLEINPLNYDFLAFEFQTKESRPLEFKATWNSQTDFAGQAVITACNSSNTYQTVYIPLSRHWRWFTNSAVTNLNLLLPSTSQISIRNARLIPASTVAPELRIDAKSDTTGVYNLGAKDKLEFTIARPKPSKSPLTVQVGKPDFFFENFPPDGQTTVVNQTLVLPAAQKQFSLNRSHFEKTGFYQVRAIMQDTNISSDPITVQRLP